MLLRTEKSHWTQTRECHLGYETILSCLTLALLVLTQLTHLGGWVGKMGAIKQWKFHTQALSIGTPGKSNTIASRRFGCVYQMKSITVFAMDEPKENFLRKLINPSSRGMSIENCRFHCPSWAKMEAAVSLRCARRSTLAQGLRQSANRREDAAAAPVAPLSVLPTVGRHRRHVGRFR